MTTAAGPLVSIITPSYGQASYIEQTIQSVLSQDYPNIEYIVIDGGSKDGTVDILKRYSDRLKWVSEPDEGQTDAINKGFRMATGSIFAWLNADDLYVPGTISTIVNFFNANPDIAFVYGDVMALNGEEKAFGIRTHVRQTNFKELVTGGDNIVQPGAFWRAEVWHTIGELDKSLRYTMDYEYWMRAASRYELRYIPICLARERLHTYAKTFSGGVERVEEIEAVAIRHGGDGLPYNFRAEAAANYVMRAIRRFFRRQPGVRDDLKRAISLHPPRGVFLEYLGVFLFLGPGALPRVWLYLNRRRAHRKASTVMPSGEPAWPLPRESAT